MEQNHQIRWDRSYISYIDNILEVLKQKIDACISHSDGIEETLPQSEAEHVHFLRSKKWALLLKNEAIKVDSKHCSKTPTTRSGYWILLWSYDCNLIILLGSHWVHNRKAVLNQPYSRRLPSWKLTYPLPAGTLEFWVNDFPFAKVGYGLVSWRVVSKSSTADPMTLVRHVWCMCIHMINIDMCIYIYISAIDCFWYKMIHVYSISIYLNVQEPE